MFWKEVTRVRKGESLKQVSVKDEVGRLLPVVNEVCEMEILL